MMKVIRTWKRDGSTNRMPVLTAAKSIVHSLAKHGEEVPTVEVVEARLENGEVLETQYAEWQAE